MTNFPDKSYNLITNNDITAILAECSIKMKMDANSDKQFKIGDILNQNKKDLGHGPKWRSINEKYRK